VIIACMQPREIIQATEPIYRIGQVFYFHPDTLARGKAAGLDGFRFYILGRGGVLGDVEPGVVHASFGYFHTSLIDKIWNSAKDRMAPRDAARLYFECVHDLGRAKLSDTAGLDGFVDAATAVIGAVEGASLPLFAGVRAEPVPDDVPAAALHQAVVMRELRGSVHLLALTACGVSTPVAHAIKRPGDVATFGYDEVPEVTDDDRANWHRAEELTDALLEPAYASLTDAQAIALVNGTAAMAHALDV
jgi:hypothetical protein